MTNLKQVHTYTTPEVVEDLKIRAKQHGMTMSKYIEYLIMKDIQKGKNSTTEKRKISLAKNFRGRKPIFFAKENKKSKLYA